MGILSEWLGVGKPVMWAGLGTFHLFLGGTVLTGRGEGDLRLKTGILLLFVGTGMFLWGFRQHRAS
ncbi:MAG: hypothetical protein ABEJ27_00420 [Halodesulfurarchaeum sp.]